VGRSFGRDHGESERSGRTILRAGRGKDLPASPVLQNPARAEGLLSDNAALAEYLLRLADDRLVLGHRLSEWCGHGPILEEDIALANIALDLIGQATLLLKLAGEIEGKGRNEDSLAYFRETIDYRNVHLVEFPKGDYAFTIVRQFLFDVFSYHLLEELQKSTNKELAGIAAKGFKEVRYHVRHSSEWVARMGDGTEESHTRSQKALDHLWRFTGELFETDEVDRQIVAEGIGADVEAIAPKWRAVVDDVMNRATLTIPADPPAMTGGRKGRHTEHLGHMLSEMQIVARSHPGAEW
jgi:ring-1,2-phenylacetyl-CoA epoxidase subunit PaaC